MILMYLNVRCFTRVLRYDTLKVFKGQQCQHSVKIHD